MHPPQQLTQDSLSASDAKVLLRRYSVHHNYQRVHDSTRRNQSEEKGRRRRRGSNALLEQEDTDEDFKITVDNGGLKTEKPRGRLYIPRDAPEQFQYYTDYAKSHPEAELDVILLPERITPAYVRDLNDAPGLLALAVEKVVDLTTKTESLRGLLFPVPGARFNKLYGWDSYFIVLSLLRSGHMALKTYETIKHKPGALELLRTATLAAIKEYYTVWTASTRLDPVTGLSRYQAEGLGVPPETEKSYFLHVLQPYADKYGFSVDDFIRAYNFGEVSEPSLDEYFLHDRSLRESGHDTTYRLEHVCADLVTIDLNSLLYKYEMDISFIIRTYFGDALQIPATFASSTSATIESSAPWDRRAQLRKAKMDQYLWNEDKAIFLDYNTKTGTQMPYESTLRKFESHGGLAACTESSRGRITLDRPNRQWDYPYGWAPHQIMAWTGLVSYGYHGEAQRLAYKWLCMMTKTFVEFNGVVVEKYDVTRPTGPHKVDAEYGNQGADFRGVAREGFGWANASYLCGLELMNTHMKRALGVCAPYELLFRTLES
ncbi:alpha,alpha-trehalase nth1 [Aspergillus nanangensis]|uniref:Trehalase n=1 Tax=Aspergillus nanangensis TaxID=2582783 RepID=A0AAD4GTR8_ASPNN|nr:alpha,alpha-trehalase nth1 [Aspergillus nanangensis]